jgi:hypothetical protein
MSDTKKSTYYGDKKYRYLSKDESDALKSLLPVSWPRIVINKVEKALKKDKHSFPYVPKDYSLYAMVNGRIRDISFMPLIRDLALERKKINDDIKDLTREVNASSQ